MLIYNYQKEFLGIDEAELNALGFSDFTQLRSESADFADLFVKTPGYVHNFKHVHWIDFVTCAEGSEDSKVIIHANGKNFKCTLDIKIAYLVDSPTEKAYIINLVNLRALTHGEGEKVAGDIIKKPEIKRSAQSTTIIDSTQELNKKFMDNKPADKPEDKPAEIIELEDEPEEELEITIDPYETSTTDTLDELNKNPNIIEDMYESISIDIDDVENDLDEEKLDIEIEEDNQSVNEVPEVIEDEIVAKSELKATSLATTQVLNVGADYVYNPSLASDELGLPIDLIEEFIQDFINQAIEFKDDLYRSIDDADIDHVKILSHKLKGVAANLRIEDAFEVLSTINTSEDYDEIKMNIDTFYVIIDKLSGKSTQADTPIEIDSEDKNVSEDDDLILSFKDNEEDIQIQIEEPEVPQKIEIAELADDDFIAIDDEEDIQIQESEVPQTIEMPELADDDFIAIDDSEEDIQIQESEVPQTIEMPELDEVQEIAQDNSQSTYDKNSVANEIGIDIQNFNKLFEDYMLDSNNICDLIGQHIDESSPNLWRRDAIKLKGMSDNMRIHNFTAEIELIIHTQDSIVAKEALNTISAKLKQLSKIEV